MKQDSEAKTGGRHVVILYNAVSADAGPDAKDVLDQVEAVAAVLPGLGHTVSRVACTLNLEALAKRLETERPDVVLNLVESLGDSDQLAPLAPAVMDSLGIPYTGSRTEALFATAAKLPTKRALAAGGLPTPGWMEDTDHSGPPAKSCRYPGRFIIKTLHEHASFGIDDGAVVEARSETELKELLRQRAAVLERPCFAEQFIAGREFNISILAGPDGPEVLPCAEIDFGAFPAGKPQIVGYDAKWAADSFEYQQTPRRFVFPPEDRPLLERLADLTRRTWHLFDLGGHVRVDFRVDGEGKPWILEVNTNPCLSPDAGFRAALDRAGIDFATAVDRILHDALRRQRELPGKGEPDTAAAHPTGAHFAGN